jgi:PAS domain S-box-containing protein
MFPADTGVGQRGGTAPLVSEWGLLCSVDSRGYFTSVGEGWDDALGWTREELTSRPYADFVHPGERAATLAAVSNVWHGDTVILDTRFRARGGSWQRIRWTPAPDRQEAQAVLRARPMRSGGPRLGTALKGALALAGSCGLVILIVGLMPAPTLSDKLPASRAMLARELPRGLHGPIGRFGSVVPTWHGAGSPPGVIGAPLSGVASAAP